jgi:hypothetical protein
MPWREKFLNESGTATRSVPGSYSFDYNERVLSRGFIDPDRIDTDQDPDEWLDMPQVGQVVMFDEDMMFCRLWKVKHVEMSFDGHFHIDVEPFTG